MTTRAPRRGRPLLVAAALVALEGLAAVVFAVVEATQIQTGRVVMGAGVAVILGGYGLLLGAVARGVARARRWSRGLAVVTQLVVLLLGYSFREPPTTVAGLLMAGVALITLGCLLAPSSTRAFLEEDHPKS